MNKVLFILFVLIGYSAFGDEFSDLSATFGLTMTLVGIHQSATNDPNGAAINFWQPSFEGGPATSAALSNPHMAQADAFGNVYIADKASHSILRISTDGTVHTFAGTHVAGFNGDGPALATSLMLNNPNGLFVFPNGVVYLLDPGNRRIRRVGNDGVMTTILMDPDPDWYPSGRALWVSPDEQLIYYTNELAPVPPQIIANGAVVKKWTPTDGIEIVCSQAVGFRNPGNLAVNPVDGKLYVCDRAEDDTTKVAAGLWRIDGPDMRTRITGNGSQPVAADGQLVIFSFVDQPRGIAFLSNGSYFICGHKDGSVWYVDTAGVMHRYMRGRATKDFYNLTDGLHPPLTGFSPSGQEWFSQPRSVAIAPDGNLLVVCADSGFVFKVSNVAPHLPTDFQTGGLDAEGLHLRWSGLFSRGYLVERTFTLQPPNWQIIGAAGGTPVGHPSEYADPDALAHTRAFYRLAPAL